MYTRDHETARYLPLQPTH